VGNELQQRLFDFSVNIITFLRGIKETTENKIIKKQLIKSCTSAAANYEEAQAASSRADFRNKIHIALKEMRETNYWLRILKAIDKNNNNENLNTCINESEQLKKILGSITVKLNKSKK
jgi:four helix bundle protein